MPIKKSCFIFFLFIYSVAFAQQATINLEADNMALSEVIEYIEKNHGFLFSYKEDDIKGIDISTNSKNETVDYFLKKILADKNLNYEIINGNYIILKKASKTDTENTNNDLPLFCGKIIDSLTQQPLPYATISFKKSNKGNYSNEDGEFNFRSDFSKNDTIVISHVGYGEKYYSANHFTNAPCPTISLNYYEFGEDFIVITDYLTDGIDLADNGATTVLKPNKIGALPGQAEPDIFTTIQFLPGINSPKGEAGGMYVRGGAADQNLILWEGIPIYHPAHFFGMISAFNPYIIDKVKVHRGGFESKYGGRVSSLIELESADYNINKSTHGAGVNFLNAYTHGQIAFGKNKGSVVYSLRRSISELWRSPTFNNIAQRNQQSHLQIDFDNNAIPDNFTINDEFNFLDAHFKTSYQISEKDNFSIAYFYNKNNFNDEVRDPQRMEKQINTLDLISQGGSFSFNRKWAKSFSSQLLISTSIYDYDYAYDIRPFPNAPGTDKFGQKLNMIKENQIHFNNELKINNQHLLKFGHQYTNYDVSHLINHQDGRRPDPFTSKEDEKSSVNSGYLTFNSSNKNKIGVDAGFRLSYFEQKSKNYYSPRFRFWYKPTDHLTFQANAGKYYQYISQLLEFDGDDRGFNTPIWVINGTKEADVLSATQYQLGLIFNKKGWVVDLQAYSKKTKELTSLAIDYDVDVEKAEDGNSDARGVDILIKKRWKKFRTWASYSLAQTDYNFPRFFDEDFAAPFDIRHAFHWASQLAVGHFEFSLGAHICSGSPYTIMSGYDRRQGHMNQPDFADPEYEAYNNSSLPTQHRLDASVLYSFKKGEKLNGVIGLSLFNIYQQKNIYARDYWVKTPPNQDWEIVYSEKPGLGLTPNMVFRISWK